MRILFLPLLIPTFFMGWALYSMGYQKGGYKKQQKLLKKDNVTIMPIVFEEQQEIGGIVSSSIYNS
jgi:hypothetical protein